MKIQLLTKALVLIGCFLCFNLSAQISEVHSHGGNAIYPEACIGSEARENMLEQMARNRKELNLIPSANTSRMADDLIFPLRMKEEIPGLYKFYYTSSFVDQDNSSDFTDFNCLEKGFDGHKGIDFYVYPHPWYLQENDLVEVIAATAGTIIFKEDGLWDQSCTGGGEGNTISVMHEDGSSIIYTHLKFDSLTDKEVGDTVEQGEFLGIVGSSGYSFRTNLHIECYNENNNLIDPFEGMCNDTPNSLWQDQPPHSDPTVNAILTHDIEPAVGWCPDDESTGLRNIFYPGETIYLCIYLSDYIANENFNVSIEAPSGFTITSFVVTSTNSFYWYYNWISLDFPEGVPEGRYRVICNYGDQSFIHFFEFYNEPSSTEDELTSNIHIYPNPTDGLIFIEGLQAQINEYEILDVLGVKLSNGNIEHGQISIEELPTGVYLLNIKSKDGIVGTRKIVKE